MIKILCLIFITLNLSGCFVTSKVIQDLGVKRGTIYRASHISGTGNDYLIELTAHANNYPNQDMFFWKRLSRDSLFALPEHDVNEWKPSVVYLTLLYIWRSLT